MSNVQTLLAELAVTLTVRVAETLSHASRDMAPQARQQIDEMIQTQLPDVILKSLYQTEILHTSQGIDHLRENLDYYVIQFAQRFIKNDS